MDIKKLSLAVGLAVAALGAMGASGVVNAAPMLQIVDGTGNPAQPPSTLPCSPSLGTYHDCEVTGDAGGTAYPSGIPSANGGWTTVGANGFAQDGSFGNVLGTSGWHAMYLNLSEAARLVFQYVGDGNAANHNQFQVNTGSGWMTVFDNNSTPIFTTASFSFNAGLVGFRYLASIGTADASTVTNDGTGNPDEGSGSAGYFLGIDPYLATGAWDTQGTAAYIGLTDLPWDITQDHDFQDMGIRVSVPEPGSIFLLGSGLLGLARMRRRKA